MALFRPWRQLGLVCDGARHCRPVIHHRGSANFLTCPVDEGRALHRYELGHLHLIGAIPLVTDDGDDSAATALAVRDDLTFVALGRIILVYQNMKRMAAWDRHENDVTHLLLLGTGLVSISKEERRVITWSSTGDVQSDVYLDVDFVPTAVVHPATYINKVVLGSTDGRLEVWNLRRAKKIYSFSSLGAPISVLADAPVLDVVAAGLADGRVVFFNLRLDKILFQVGGPARASLDAPKDLLSPLAITALSFRTDGTEILAATDRDGNLSIVDLARRRVSYHGVLLHPGGVSLAEFLPRDAVLVTCGSVDNTVKMMVFDGAQDSPRFLRGRDGLLAPPRRLRFCGKDARQLVCAGDDRELRIISLIRDSQNLICSQKAVRGTHKRAIRHPSSGPDSSGNLMGWGRLPPVIDIAVGESRRRDLEYANIVTAHQGVAGAHLWRMDAGAALGKVLLPPRGAQDSVVRRVGVSRCGNFAIVGMSDGKLHSFNLQSALHVGEYHTDGGGSAHAGPIGGISMDSAGDSFASGGEEDEIMRIWMLRSRKLVSSVPIEAGVQVLVWSDSADLIAVGGHDLSIRVFDAETKTLARKFDGPSGRVTDVAFSADSRWLLCTSMDGTLRVWDVPSGKALQIIHCRTPPTALAFAPDMSFLATAHVDSRGICMWTNASWYAAQDGKLLEDDSAEANTGPVPCSDMDNALVTLSGEPPARWAGLSTLETRRRRARIQVPNEEEPIPFFLPVTGGLAPVFDTSALKRGQPDDSATLMLPGKRQRSSLERLLRDQNSEKVSAYLDSLGPSGLDLEIRTLANPRSLASILRLFDDGLQGRRRFELTQSRLELFLLAHGNELTRVPSSHDLLSTLKHHHDASWNRIESLFSHVMSLSSFLTRQRGY